MFNNISALDFLVFAAYYLILKFVLTWVTARWPEKPLTSALGALL